MADEPSLTELIKRAERGDVQAADRLFAAMYADLRRLARVRLRAGGRSTLLDTSSLVHESYLRFARAGQLQLRDRIHFMRWAGRAMRIRLRENAVDRLRLEAPVRVYHSPVDEEVDYDFTLVSVEWLRRRGATIDVRTLPGFDHVNSWIQAMPRAVRWFRAIQ